MVFPGSHTHHMRLEAFCGRVMALVQCADDLGTALAYAEWLAFYLCENPCGIYRQDSIELTVLQKAWASNEAVWEELHQAAGQPDATELHVATFVYRSGGHSQLMRILMQGAERPAHALVSAMSSRDEVSQILALSPDQVSTLRPGLPAALQIEAMVRVMLRHKVVFLHIHPHDVTSAVAVRLAKRLRPSLKVFFVNHADHVFSVGIGAADEVLEISAYGWGLQASRGLVDRGTFIGLPIEVSGVSSSPAARVGAAALPFMLTGGASYKFRPVAGQSLPRSLRMVLDALPELRLVVVGAGSKDWWWWSLRLRYGDRVQVMKSLPKAQYKALLEQCAIYVDSHPWSSGTAFPEAVMAGRPVAALWGLVWGYSVADALRAADETEFVQACTQIISGELAMRQRQESVRLRCMAEHAPATVRARVDALLLGHRSPLPQELSAHPPRLDTERHRGLAARSVLPPRKKAGLSLAQLRAISGAHRATFGWFDISSLKLWFYAWRQPL